jgi:hypothetical protein
METTLIHSDLTQRAVVDTLRLEWIPSVADRHIRASS